MDVEEDNLTHEETEDENEHSTSEEDSPSELNVKPSTSSISVIEEQIPFIRSASVLNSFYTFKKIFLRSFWII